MVLTGSRTLPWPGLASRGASLTWARVRVVGLALAVMLAFGFRIAALSTYGFGEDEVNKVHAIEQYRAGHFGANAEHPMLMKLAMWGSVELAGVWNRVAPSGAGIALETAVRLPNAIAGTATGVVLFAVAELLFGTSVAIVASLFWALDVNATAINRIGKEDTFLLFFFLLAVWFYERAKRQGVTDPDLAQRWYTSSGASFGLMLASKYFLHYLGIYALFNRIADPRPGANRPDKRRFYGAMMAAFLAANFPIVIPSTWRYLVAYVRGSLLTHHGSWYAGQLYVTNIPVSPLGIPATYYLQVIATKVPLVVLGAGIAGLIELTRRRHERGFVLLRVLLVFLLVPYSLMAAKFLRYTLPLLAVIDLMAAVGLVAGIGWLLRTRWLSRPVRVRVSAAALIVSLGSLALAQVSAAPFSSLFQNAFGERLAPAGATFPEETYDYGVREAVGIITGVAQPGAVIVSDASSVVAQYVAGSSRRDIEVRSLSGQGLPPPPRETWVLVQNAHIYFENEAVIDQLRRWTKPWCEIRARGTLAVQVFRLGG